ncbi:MAG: ATP synthase subunit I [Daejeonella sp.]|uniref:ATP synthase subunit I n=1 Tax=Daejeonella sp. TaxID=2805397 RepID=UPI002735188B|nr:ATP synthase subunit I [Daejeonella sp.]MDP3468280.1 ATP synthase subunit I [Daejeonella sp.]
MNEVLYMILAFAAGIVLGTLFYGGLWLTVKRSISAKVPAIWLIAGFIIRVSITLIGFYYISRGNWMRLLICLLGFIVARVLVFWITKKYEQKKISINMNTDYEA